MRRGKHSSARVAALREHAEGDHARLGSHMASPYERKR
jgi:hypothetical protein